MLVFKDLPDTSTPINAQNLNNNFNELLSNITNLVSAETVSSDSITVKANSEYGGTINISKKGYTAMGILWVDVSSNGVDLLKFSQFGNTFYYRIKNIGSNSVNIVIKAKVLYIKS